MGHIATVIIYLDELDAIRDDPDFGKNFAAAVLKKSTNPSENLVTIPVRDQFHSSTVGQVIETHPDDFTVTVKIAGNTGKIVP